MGQNKNIVKITICQKKMERSQMGTKERLHISQKVTIKRLDSPQ